MSTISLNRLGQELPEDLCFIICNNVKRGRRKWRGDLARLARSCRFFKESALNALWRDMNSLVPLFKLVEPLQTMVIELRAGCPNGVYTYLFDINHDMVAEDWVHFDKYNHRIRSFKYTFDPCCNFGHIRFVAQERQESVDTPFLPNLSKLVWNHKVDLPIDGGVASTLSVLTTPELRSIHIEGRLISEGPNSDLPGRDPYLASFFNSLPDKLERLEEFVLHGNMARVPLGFLSRFKHLTKLDLDEVLMEGDAVTKNVFRGLTALETLTSLSVSLVTIITGNQIIDASDEGEQEGGGEDEAKAKTKAKDEWGDEPTKEWSIFPRLRNISLNWTLITLATDIAGWLPTTTLEMFRVKDLDEPSSLVEMRGLCSKLSHFSSLTEVHISCDSIRDNEHNGKIMLFDAIQPLLLLPNLRSLELNSIPSPMRERTELRLYLSGYDIKRMAAAWPHWERFELTCETDLDTQILAAFAEHCPHLAHLRLLQVDIEEDFDASSIPTASSQSLRTLWIEYLQEEIPDDFVDVLDRLFPRLDLDKCQLADEMYNRMSDLQGRRVNEGRRSVADDDEGKGSDNSEYSSDDD